MEKTVLVTGGLGYIGSHTCVELLKSGYRVVVIDNLCNSKLQVLDRIQLISGGTLTFYEADIADKVALMRIFQNEPISVVIHFAGLKAVGESCQKPLMYYENNVNGALVLLDVMQKHHVKQLVFSSSATVYKESDNGLFTEGDELGATNPYGRSKAMIEDILRDISVSDKLSNVASPWKIAILRYFNPIGAHPSGMIGEDPNGIPNNLLPYLLQVAIGRLKQLSVYGGDYPTRDGTGVRDYIHVVDLAIGHLKAIEVLDTAKFKSGSCVEYNLGTGRGYSVLEIINTFERVTGIKINYQIVSRRPGDIAEFFANPALALQDLGWKTEKTLDDMLIDSWKWQSDNPQGYN